MASSFLENFPDNSNFAESFRLLRTNVQFSFLDQELGALLVTSADAGEGKSTCVANLAYTQALAGKSVLMIDADLRKPSLHRIFPAKDSPGLSGLLLEVFSTDVSAGSLADFRLADLVRLVAFQNRTGVLQLAEDGERIDIHFHQGEMVDVVWHTRPEDKKMAAILVRDNVITRDQAQFALDRHRHTGQRLGMVLINTGLVRENDIAGYIGMHLMEALRTALQFTTGTYAFDRRDQTRFDNGVFNPADLPKLYHEANIGQASYVFIQAQVDACIMPAGAENLFFLPSGSHPPKPAELLGSERMAFLVAYLRRRFDILVIDTPPILLAGDALLLAPQVDGVVYVVKAGQAGRELIKKGVEQLQRSQANLIGVVLNQVDIRKSGYYKGYYKYQSYYDGDREG